MNTFRRFLYILALLFVVTAPYARADDAAEARRRYNEGKTALEAGRYREAALNFEAAGRLRKHGAAPYAAAMAWDKAEEPARAADNFHRAIELPGLNAKSKKEAQERLDQLEESLGTVVVSGPEELVVQFEGSTEANPPARLHAPPGINTLLVARDDKIERRDLKLKAGEVLEVDVTEPIEEPEPEPEPVASAPASAEPAPPPPVVKADTDDKQTRKIIGYSAMGAGVLSAGVAVTLGFNTLSARDDFEEQRTQESYDDAKKLRTWTNVAWVGAAVLGGVGAALVFWPTEDDDKKGQEGTGVSLSPTPTGVQLRGSF